MKPIRVNPTHLPVISCIYSIMNMINGKFYIGSAKHYYDRSYVHTRFLINGKHCNRKLQLAWRKYGEENFEFDIVEIINNPTAEKLVQREQTWIDFLKPEYNINKVATSSLGVTRSNQTKGRCSKAAMGNQNAKGSKRTPEQNKANSERNKGNIPSAETLLKISLKLRGRKCRREHVEKRVKSRKRNRAVKKLLSDKEIVREISDRLTAFLIASCKI